MRLNTKILLSIFFASVVIYTGTIWFITGQSKKTDISYAETLTSSYSKELSHRISAHIATHFGVARSIASTFSGYENFPDSLREQLCKHALRHIFDNGKDYLSASINWELHYIDSLYRKKHGRERYTITLNNEKPTVTLDSLDLFSNNITSFYYQVKTSKEEKTSAPFYYSFSANTRDILAVSINVPILSKGNFVGLVRLDMPLEKLHPIIETDLLPSSYLMMVSNGGTIVYHSELENIGQDFSKIEPTADEQFKLSNKIEDGETGHFPLEKATGEVVSYSFSALPLGNTDTPWSIIVVASRNELLALSDYTFRISIMGGCLGILVLIIIIGLFSKRLTTPLAKTATVLDDMANGHINQHRKLRFKSSDEIGQIADSVNKLIDGLTSKAEFAKEIGAGNLDVAIEDFNKEDVLGSALVDMRRSLKNARMEEEARQVEDKKLNWATKGYAKFGDLMRMHNENLDEFCYLLLSNLTKYTEANMGGFYVINDDNENFKFIELRASFAFDRKKQLEKRFEIGQGLVGRCVQERKKIIIDSVPKGYMKLSSGLGNKTPNAIVVVPLIYNNEVFGALEFGALEMLEDYKINFIQNIGESFASSISNIKNNIKTKHLLEESKKQSEALSEKEEKLRQNLQEIKTTQQEMDRVKAKEAQKSQALMDALTDQQVTLSSILDNLPGKVQLKAPNGKVLMVNEAFAKLHGKSAKDFIGLTAHDLFDPETAEQVINQDKAILDTGEQVYTEELEFEGETRILETTQKPFYIASLKTNGLLTVQVDITEQVMLKRELDELRTKQ